MDMREYIEKETGIPTAEVAFTEGQDLPYIAILDAADRDGDDFHIRTVEHDLIIELYSERINAAAEGRIETALEKQHLKYRKERIWINSEKMFETVYNANFMEKR